MSEFNQSRREGVVKSGYDFDTLEEVLRLWDLTATRLPFHNCCHIPGRDDVICLLLTEDGGKGWHNIPHYGSWTDSRGWRGVELIDEFNDDPGESQNRVEDELARPRERYVFWRMSRDGVNWYKFQGVFKLDAAATLAAKEEGRFVCIYRKVSEAASCVQSGAGVTDISAEALKAAVGKVLEAQLRDDIGYMPDEKGEKPGTVKVWPGDKLVIESVSPSGSFATCVMDDTSVRDRIRVKGAVRFTVPKRDIELGYFRLI